MCLDTRACWTQAYARHPSSQSTSRVFLDELSNPTSFLTSVWSDHYAVLCWQVEQRAQIPPLSSRPWSDHRVVLRWLLEQRAPRWTLKSHLFPREMSIWLLCDTVLTGGTVFKSHLFPREMSIWLPCGTVLTSEMHDDLSLIRKSNDRSCLPHLTAADIMPSIKVCHYIIWSFVRH